MSNTSDPPPPYECYDSTGLGPRLSLPTNSEPSYGTETAPEDDHPILYPPTLLELLQSSPIESNDSSEGSEGGVDADDEWSLSQTTFSDSSLNHNYIQSGPIVATRDLHENCHQPCCCDCQDCTGYDSSGNSVYSFNDDFQLNGDFNTESIGMEDVMRGEPEDLPSSNSQWGEEDIAGDMYMNSPMLLDFLIQSIAPPIEAAIALSYANAWGADSDSTATHEAPTPGPSRTQNAMFYDHAIYTQSHIYSNFPTRYDSPPNALSDPPATPSLSRVRADAELVLRYNSPSSRHHPYKQNM
ncbi:hypothetical protein FS749_000476 [Ceratobasidium sp. UAMH 11750]|nr:hypothetical protein FS749_000476 [Ceratobasidium sp. UAMH 11750]